MPPQDYEGTLTPIADSDPPRYGQTIRFKVESTHPKPWVNLLCYQNGELVAAGWESWNEGDYSFGLYSGIWQGGPANCVARLCFYDGKGKDLYTEISRIEFSVIA